MGFRMNLRSTTFLFNLAIGGIVISGGAIGLLALGGFVIGIVAIGGEAIGYYDCGSHAIGVHVVSLSFQDPQAVEFFRRYFPNLSP